MNNEQTPCEHCGQIHAVTEGSPLSALFQFLSGQIAEAQESAGDGEDTETEMIFTLDEVHILASLALQAGQDYSARAQKATRLGLSERSRGDRERSVQLLNLAAKLADMASAVLDGRAMGFTIPPF